MTKTAHKHKGDRRSHRQHEHGQSTDHRSADAMLHEFMAVLQRRGFDALVGMIALLILEGTPSDEEDLLVECQRVESRLRDWIATPEEEWQRHSAAEPKST
jgi:hypothetical protein